MLQDEIVEGANDLVEEFEEPLKQRRKERLQNEAEAKVDEFESRSGTQFETPPIIGCERYNTTWKGEQIKFKLSEPISGTDKESITIDFPAPREVTDDSHELNRLLQYYGLSIENSAEINGEKLPLLRTNGFNSEEPKYKLHTPPINTTLNTTLYKIKRLAYKMKLIKYGSLPSSTTVCGLLFDGNSDVPAQFKPYYHKYHSVFGLDYDSFERGFIPTVRLLNLMMGFTFVSLVSTLIATIPSAISVFSLMLLGWATIFFLPAIFVSASGKYNALKERYLPNV